MGPKRIKVTGQELADALIDARVFGAAELLRRHHPESHLAAFVVLRDSGHGQFVREICREAVVNDRTFNNDIHHLMLNADPTELTQWETQAAHAKPSLRRQEVIAVSALVQGKMDVARHFWEESFSDRTFRGHRGLRTIYWADTCPPGRERSVIQWLLDNREPHLPIAQAVAGHPDPLRQGAWVDAVLQSKQPDLIRALADQSKLASVGGAPTKVRPDSSPATTMSM